MKNKVDIDKLIEKKYKGNTLDLNDLLDEIDLVLQESDQSYLHSKIIPANLEENPESENIAYRMGQVGNRNPVSPEPGYSGKEPSEVIPDKIAEAPQQALQKQVNFTVKVPDLYSLMTNPKAMNPSSEDRKTINDIMANINAPMNTWYGRIQALKKYTSQLGITPSTGKNVTEAISSLMILNVLKKLSFFTDQPGKQFEYIFSAIMHPQAEVIGDEAKQVEDVGSPTGKVSLKFLQSGDTTIEASGENLRKAINVKDVDNAFVDYIIVRSFGTGVIQFGRIGITNVKEFVDKHYEIIKDYSKKSLLMALKEPDPRGIEGRPAFVIYLKEGGVTTAGASQKSISSQDKLEYNILGLKISSDSYNKKIDVLGGKTLGSYVNELEANKNDIKKLQKLLSFLPQYTSLSPQDKQQNTQNIASDVVDYIRKRTQEIKNIQTSVPGLQKENKNLLQEETFAISSIWKNIVVESLDLGDVEKYNEQQLSVSDSIQKMYVDVLENLDSLNKNITLYFATGQGKNQNAGEQAKTNAQNIVESVNNIQGSGTTDKTARKPRNQGQA
jgi:hypothetical protein